MCIYKDFGVSEGRRCDSEEDYAEDCVERKLNMDYKKAIMKLLDKASTDVIELIYRFAARLTTRT